MKIQPRPESLISTSTVLPPTLPTSTAIPASLFTSNFLLSSQEQEPAVATPSSPTSSVSSLLAIDIPPSRTSRRAVQADLEGFRRRCRLVVVNPDPVSDASSDLDSGRTSKRRRREVSVISAPLSPPPVSSPFRPTFNTGVRRPQCGICKDPIIVRPNNGTGPTPEETIATENLTGVALKCYGANLGHTYCFPCLATYFRTKLGDAPFRTVFPIRCPECPYIIIEDLAKRILTKKDMEDVWYWAKLFGNIQTFYCPNGACGQRIEQPTPECARSIRRSICPACQEAFCYRCQVPWHEGKTCAQHARSLLGRRNGAGVLNAESSLNDAKVAVTSCVDAVTSSATIAEEDGETDAANSEA
ncbi:hypothetical protein FRC01_009550 [Tulasnella sp. 417]|nr:hypothetical protein FRC01_009550 [Tulasnella sp. 417]